MSSNSPPNASSNAPKGRAKACTACRQVKLKCDAREVYPAPCTRCKNQSLDCRMDPSFKRVPARRQLEEVSNRLMSLQKSLGLDQNLNLPRSGLDPTGIRKPEIAENSLENKEDIGNWPRIGLSSNSPTSTDQLSHENDKFLNIMDEVKEGSWMLGDVTLSYEQVFNLFRHFDTTLFRHLPILEPCRSIHGLYKTSELLFWSIILVSTRLYNAYDTIYLRLVPHHRMLLSVRLMTEKVTLEEIHAVLLICTWPYPVSKQYDDLTWMLCGIANNLAMILGLHKPNHTHEYGDDSENMPGSAYIRNVTWLACFQISTSVASWLGMPPPISSSAHLETIDTLCRDSSLPKPFRARADIQRQMALITTALDAKLDSRTRFSLIKMYEQELARLQTTFADAWSDELEIEWLGAKLYLYGMAFVAPGPNSPRLGNQNRAVSAREILQYGLAAGSRLLNTIASIKLPYTAPGTNKTTCSDFIYQLAFYPKQFFRVGAFANFFLLWYLAVDVQASEEDKDLARTYVGFTYRLLYSFKHSPEHVRAAKSIEMLTRIRSSENGPPASHLLVNSRLGASFMYSLNYNERLDLRVEEPLVDLPMLGLGVQSHTGAVSLSTDSFAGSSPSSAAYEGENNLQELPNAAPAYSQSKAPQQEPPRSITEALQSQPPIQQTQTHLWQQQQQQQQQQKQQPPPPRQLQPQSYQQSASGGSTYSPDNVFANAFFQDTTNQNFDFLWQGWDPNVFDDLKMDVDTTGQVQLAPTGSTEYLP